MIMKTGRITIFRWKGIPLLMQIQLKINLHVYICTCDFKIRSKGGALDQSDYFYSFVGRCRNFPVSWTGDGIVCNQLYIERQSIESQ